jgi:uncharacterized protein YcfJ
MTEPERSNWVPWDPLVGLRVGAIIGALVGVAITAIAGSSFAWVIIVAGALGGGFGYWYQRNRRPEQ